MANLESKVDSDSLHVAVLKSYKEYLMTPAETKSFFGTVYLHMPISLQVNEPMNEHFACDRRQKYVTAALPSIPAALRSIDN